MYRVVLDRDHVIVDCFCEIVFLRICFQKNETFKLQSFLLNKPAGHYCPRCVSLQGTGILSAQLGEFLQHGRNSDYDCEQ